MSICVLNPYFGKSFWQFLFLFFHRIQAFITGQTQFSDLASDEIQVLVLCCVAVATALIGTFLVLKKMTMLANSLSHTILLGIIIAYLLPIPFMPSLQMHSDLLSVQVLLIASFATGLMTTVLTQMLTHLLKLQEDASTGLVFTTLFALGLVLVTVFTRNTHLGTEAIMGNVDALHPHDLVFIFWIALFNLVIVALFFKEFKMTTFDPVFATTQGVSSTVFNYFIMVLTTATVIGAFRAVGVLLVLSFLVAPVLTARLFTHRLKKLLLFSSLIGIFASLVSVALARHLLSVYHIPISTSGLASTVLGGIYLIAVSLKIIERIYKKKVVL